MGMLVLTVAGTVTVTEIVIVFVIVIAMLIPNIGTTTHSSGNRKTALERVLCLILLLESCNIWVYRG